MRSSNERIKKKARKIVIIVRLDNNLFNIPIKFELFYFLSTDITIGGSIFVSFII